MTHNRPLVLFIACSLDGYIATEDGRTEWLSLVEHHGEDYGYAEFISTVDTVIMGRKTYEKVLGFGIAFPHRGKKCFVLSRTRTGADKNVEFYAGDIGHLVASIRKTPGGTVFCDGGAVVVHELMMRNLIDRYIISIIPVLLGKGIALFKSERPMTKLSLIKSHSYPSGLVQVVYGRT